MKTITSLYLLVSFICGLFSIDTSPEYRHEDRELTKFERQAIALLKKKFDYPLLDTELKTLRELSDSDEYVNFLSKKYPEQAPFTTFKDCFYKIRPPKELYFEVFFKKQLDVQRIEDVGDDELFIAYAYMAAYWTLGAYERGGDQSPVQRLNSCYRIGQYILAKTPEGREFLYRRLGIDPTTKHVPWLLILDTFEPLLWLATPIREEDGRWIKSLFDKYGRYEGMLRLAVQDPMLLDRILYTFSTDTTFLRWLYDPIDVDGTLRKR